MNVAVFIARLSKAAFLVATVLCGLVLARSIVHFKAYSVDVFGIVLAFGVPAVGLAFFLFLAFTETTRRNNAFLLLASIAIPLYAVEFYLAADTQTRRYVDTAAEFAERRGVSFDRRSPLEVIRDSRKQGQDILSTLVVRNVPFQHEKTGPMFVRGSVSGRLSLGSNESGTYVVYKSDEHGFKNPPGIWATGKVSLIAVGDSFTHGTNVPMDRDIVGVIREKIPASLNLGWNGIGPLYYYQNLVEYGSALKPAVVLYVWFEGNDVTDLLEEQRTPLLAKYIGRKAPMGLYDLQADIDRHHLGNLAVDADSVAGAGLEKARQVAMLYHVRKFLGLGAAGSRHPAILDRLSATTGRNGGTQYPPLPRETLKTILADARSLASSWGGRLVFVYLPAWERVCPHAAVARHYCPPLAHDFRRTEVLDVVASLGIETVDMALVFEAESDPLGLFFYPGSHYSERGYRLVGETILRHIGPIPQ